MSASLVGSEMCIRDRGKGVVNSLAAAARAAPRAGARPHSSVTAGFRGPVSYTHLTLPTICSV
eukprot:11675564-Alexandrium_andersonii.AAC.1